MIAIPAGISICLYRSTKPAPEGCCGFTAWVGRGAGVLAVLLGLFFLVAILHKYTLLFLSCKKKSRRFGAALSKNKF